MDKPSNIRWLITVRPDSNGDVTLVLPVTEDCATQGAICTEDGRPLSNRLEMTVTGPRSADQNTEATGAPTISGTAQVDETLTADTSGITDSDGLTNVSYSYQWIRNDGTNDADIGGQTGSTYTLTDEDVGKSIKVKVSFTDDAGNEETLTSAATAAVAAKPNAPATGAPTISGTAQVDETLTADTSGITDADGLDNAEFSYQWIRTDGGTDDDIAGATESTYTLTDDDEGKTIKLKVWFIDDKGNSETLTSAATADVGEPQFLVSNLGAGVSGAGGIQRTLYTARSGFAQAFTTGAKTGGYPLGSVGIQVSHFYDGSTVGDHLQVTINGVASEGEPGDAHCTLTNPSSFSTPGVSAFEAPTGAGSCAQLATETTYFVVIEWVDPSGTDHFALIPQTYPTEESAATEEDPGGAEGWSIADQSYYLAVSSDARTWTAYDQTASFKIVVKEAAVTAAKANSPATGAPTISGTAQVGETLTADTSPIADEDGLTNVSYSYQWIRSDNGADTDIAGETDSTYTLVYADQGKTIEVQVTFTDDDDNAETLTSVATEPVSAAANNPATGVPTISGTVQVGEALTADTSGITDADGLTNVSFSYQWTAGGSDIAGATNSTYLLTTGEQGQTIQVKVNFTDDADNQESLTSAETLPVAGKPNTAATGEPTISGTPQVDETLTAGTSAISDEDGLTNVSYRYQWTAGGSDIDGATGSTYALTSSEQGQTIQVLVTFTDDADNQESLTSAETLAVAGKPNTAATGEPTISGTPQVDETLTAGTSAISDEDGLDNVSYQYQWLRDDADIAGQTNSTYRLVSADEGKTIKVRVTFTDDAGNAESLTSAATTAVAAQPAETPAVLLTASFANVPADHNGSNFTFQLSFSENVEAGYARIRDHAFTLSGGAIASASRKTQGSNQGWNVEVNPDGNGAVSITLPETTDCDASGAICTDDSRKLSHPTSATVAGPPAISVSDATVQEAEGAVLVFTATLSHASSRTVTVDYATSDGTAVAGSDYSAASGTLTFNAGDTSQTVHVTVLTDSEDESQETLTLTISNPSQATLDDGTGTGTIENGESSSGTQEDPPAVSLTATFANMPATHNGSAFTFDLTFSEEFGISYVTLRDDAFSVTGGTVNKAKRMTQGSNIGWLITVEPDGNGDVTVTLPATTDCTDDGAICTADGRKLSNRLEFTVSGPDG